MAYRINTTMSVESTMNELGIMFRKWRVPRNDWDVAMSANSGSVTIKFRHPSGKWITVTKDDQGSVRANIRVLYLGLEEIRMIEVRGLSSLIAVTMLQIEGPKGDRPDLEAAYKTLGVPKGASTDECERAFREKVNTVHPARGGSDEELRQALEAIETIRQNSRALAAV